MAYKASRAQYHVTEKPHSGGKQPVIAYDVFSQMTSDSLYWLGWLFANVGISFINKKWKATVYADEQTLPELQAFLHFVGYKGEPYVQAKNTYVVRSQPLATILMQYGVTPMRSDREVPQTVAFSSAFWRGYVESNGHAGMYDQTLFLNVQGSEKVLRSLTAFAVMHGVAVQDILPYRGGEISFHNEGAKQLYATLVTDDVVRGGLFSQRFYDEMMRAYLIWAAK